MTCKLPLKCWCPSCRKAYDANRFKNNKEYFLKSAKKRKKEIQEWLRDLKKQPCKDCKISYPYYVMQFDHLKDKNFNLGSAVKLGFSISKIQDEIHKCDLVCANCHDIRTHSRRNEI